MLTLQARQGGSQLTAVAFRITAPQRFKAKDSTLGDSAATTPEPREGKGPFAPSGRSEPVPSHGIPSQLHSVNFSQWS